MGAAGQNASRTLVVSPSRPFRREEEEEETVQQVLSGEEGRQYAVLFLDCACRYVRRMGDLGIYHKEQAVAEKAHPVFRLKSAAKSTYFQLPPQVKNYLQGELTAPK